MQAELSVEIDRPIAEVFDYAINNVAEWSEIVIEDEVIDEKPGGGVGTTFRIVTEEKGRKMEFQGVVTRHEPPTASGALLQGQYFDIAAEYSFEDLSGRTRLTQRSTIRGKGFFRVFLFLFGWLMKKSSFKAQESDLANLKRLLETRQGSASG